MQQQIKVLLPEKTKQGLALPPVIHSRECFHLQPVSNRQTDLIGSDMASGQIKNK